MCAYYGILGQINKANLYVHATYTSVGHQGRQGGGLHGSGRLRLQRGGLHPAELRHLHVRRE